MENEEIREKLSQLPWLRQRTILLTYTGSRVYGTFIEGKSDIDMKGVCIPPEEYFLGLDRFENYDATGGKSFKTKAGETDLTIMHISKFVRDAMVGVPNNIEILFVRDEDIISTNEFGKELIAHRQDFISKAIKHKFAGYAYSQIQKLKAKNSNGTGRVDLINKYGYDTKFFMHSVRLLLGAIQILKTGTFTTFRPEYEELLACRNGKYTLDQALKIVEDLAEELELLYVDSNNVPSHPDYNKINKWLIDINKRALDLSNWEAV